MAEHYTIVFDLLSHPEHIQPPYFFYALFLGFGGLFVCLSLFLRRWKSSKNVFMIAFSLLWLVFAAILLCLDGREVLAVRRLAHEGAYKTAEGCLTAFHPGAATPSKSEDGEEVWTVGDYRFAYGEGEIRPGYHKVEPDSGFIHADSRVRVSFVTSPYYRRREILRLEVIDHGCPAAPEPAKD